MRGGFLVGCSWWLGAVRASHRVPWDGASFAPEPSFTTFSGPEYAARGAEGVPSCVASRMRQNRFACSQGAGRSPPVHIMDRSGGGDAGSTEANSEIAALTALGVPGHLVSAYQTASDVLAAEEAALAALEPG